MPDFTMELNLPTMDETARKLAAEFDIEEETHTKEPSLLEQAKFTSLEELSPGQAYKDGVLYYTAPVFLDTTKTVGKGKKAKEIPYTETHTVCVTSEKELFPYEPEELHNRGFAFPEVYLAPEKTAWGGSILKDIESDTVEYPDPYDLYFRVRKLYEKYMEYSDEHNYDQ